MAENGSSSYRIIVFWLLTQCAVSMAASEEPASLSFSERLKTAEWDLPSTIVLQSAVSDADASTSLFGVDAGTYVNDSQDQTPGNPLNDTETVQAIQDADDEFEWCQLPWFLLTFTASKLCETAVAMTEYPERWTKSRWAMDDPEYAEKYAHGARRSDVLGKLKQAVDARFIEGSSGWYLGLGASKWADSDALYASLESGYEGYWTSYLTGRMGLAVALNDEDIFGGADFGFRLQVPSRIAPFVGTGLFAGAATKRSKANDDQIDNDKDGFVDESDETKRTISGMLAAIYPEAGVHFWWTPRVRLTAYSRYLITTDGRSSDTWYAGGGIALMSGN